MKGGKLYNRDELIATGKTSTRQRNCCSHRLLTLEVYTPLLSRSSPGKKSDRLALGADAQSERHDEYQAESGFLAQRTKGKPEVG